MPIGIDLASSSLFRPRMPIQHWCAALALIALSAGCNAVVKFDDIDFGKPSEGKQDSGAGDSGKGGKGGNGNAGKGGSAGDGGSGGSTEPEMDGSTTEQDGSVTDMDSSMPEDSGMDSSVNDAGNQDSGSGDRDSGINCSAREICDNGADDDCDRINDCDDPDCWGEANCCTALPEATQALCSDLRDNDCNGKTDCADATCSGTLACCVSSGTENSTTACSNGIDDDCDGKFDCADPNCAGIGSCCAVVLSGGSGSACCTPDGFNEADQPNDGKDNDCDGLTDIPQLISAFPTQGLPSSGDEVRLNFMTELDPNATLSCSTTRPGQPQMFTACPMLSTSVKPFTALQSASPANNGLWMTQVRWDFPDGKHSSTYTFKYYIHSSLHNVSHCTSLHTDSQWFNLAHTRLGSKDAGAFKLGVDTFLLNPFVRVKYQLPVSSLAKYMLNGETPTVDMWSLRRRFTPNANNRYLLITRNYQATRSGTCSAGSIRVHVTHWSKTQAARNTFHTYSCDAIVINRAGTGVCMDNGANMAAGPIFTATKDSWDGFPISDWPGANKFMFRNLTVDSGLSAGFFYGGRNFTTKCSSAPCSGIYLPDRSMFP
jgi:hypothetical protein